MNPIISYDDVLLNFKQTGLLGCASSFSLQFSYTVSCKTENNRWKKQSKTRNRKHRQAAAKLAACAPNAVNTREQGKQGGMVR